MQSAFQVGPFATSQSTLILLNPLVSIVIGHVLFGEDLRGGRAADLARGRLDRGDARRAAGLSTSPLVASVLQENEVTHLLKGRGRFARWREREAGQ